MTKIEKFDKTETEDLIPCESLQNFMMISFNIDRHNKSLCKYTAILTKMCSCHHRSPHSPSLRCFPAHHCYDFPHVIVYLHLFGHLFFILVLLIYAYSSTVCLLRHLFMHCSCTYSCAYSCTALLYSI